MNSAAATKSSRVVIRSNAQGTVNRAQLRKLVASGRVEARTNYRLDDCDGHTLAATVAWMPARLVYGVGGLEADHYGIDSEDLTGRDTAKAYINDRGQLLLRIHQNLVVELRVVS